MKMAGVGIPLSTNWPQTTCTRWVKEKVLGKGGFGMVTLYRNEENDISLAVKECHREVEGRQRERWEQEVKVMQKLDHPNIVKGLQTPAGLPLQCNMLPPIILEYCSGGDLRKVLRQPENYCGLRETEVRAVAHGIGSAIEYLHTQTPKIIHRDLKPENIVLQVDPRGKTVYKVIDLGYIKELNYDSVCQSIVGTAQYVAPELFDGHTYNGTVDYWSFGLLIFECITGYRPFVPEVTHFQYFNIVKKKTDDVIHIAIDTQGKAQNYTEIPGPNHLCSLTNQSFRPFLQLMLQLNPAKRGGRLGHAERPQCFEMLDEILRSKVVYVYCATTLQLIPIYEDAWDQCQATLTQQTQIACENQLFLLPDGTKVDNLLVQPNYETTEEDPILLFMYGKQSCPNTRNHYVQATKRVNHLMTGVAASQQEQERMWREAVFFCSKVSEHFKYLQKASKALWNYSSQIKDECNKFRGYLHKLKTEVSALADAFSARLKIDLEYIESITPAVVLYRTFKEKEKLVKPFYDQVGEWKQLESEYKKIIRTLDSLENATAKHQKDLETQESKATTLCTKLHRANRSSGTEAQTRPKDEQMQVLVRDSDKCGRELSVHLQKYVRAVQKNTEELRKYHPRLKTKIGEFEDHKKKLAAAQDELQRKVWDLLKTICVEKDLSAYTTSSPANLYDHPPFSSLPNSQLYCGASHAMATVSSKSLNSVSLNFSSLDDTLRLGEEAKQTVDGISLADRTVNALLELHTTKQFKLVKRSPKLLGRQLSELTSLSSNLEWDFLDLDT